MVAYKTGAFVRSKYYTPFLKTPLKLISRSKSGASKSRPRWAAYIRIGNVWEYPHHPPPPGNKYAEERRIYKDLISNTAMLIVLREN